MNINFYLYIGLWNLKILREYIYNILIQFNFFIALGDEILQRIGILLKNYRMDYQMFLQIYKDRWTIKSGNCKTIEL